MVTIPGHIRAHIEALQQFVALNNIPALVIPADGDAQICRPLRIKTHNPGPCPMSHELKCWPEYYEPVAAGLKTWEYRKDDRNYAVGDTLILREWDNQEYDRQQALKPDMDDYENAVEVQLAYTGRACRRRVTYVARGGLIPEGYVIMSMVEVTE